MCGELTTLGSAASFLHDVQMRPVNYRDGVVDIEVLTRDTWSLDLGVSAGRSGGANSSGLRLKEYNLFGSGATISLGRSKNVDRSGTELQFSNNRTFGTWTAIDLSHTTNSDGRCDAASAAGDLLTRPDFTQSLLLGGDNGLRGYPLRYQSGSRRALFTVEERFYTDLYLWRLFRIGGAGFVDVGRAWGGEQPSTINPGWLGDAGFGLRIVSARSAFGNVLQSTLRFR